MNELNCILKRESALPVVLSGRQMSMVAFGTVISYGLVSGSAFPLLLAGPAAVPAYVAAALVALLLMACVGSTVSRYPTPGAFGSYAECYLGPTTGFLVRAAYLASLVLIIGTEVSLLAPIIAAWLPYGNAALQLCIVLACLTLVNAGGAKAFARCEVALSMFKVAALIALIGLACYYAANGTSAQPQTQVDLVSRLASVPFVNIWQAFMLATLGFIGIESLSIVAAETQSTERALRRRLRITALAVVGLTLASVTAAAAVIGSGVVALSLPPFDSLLKVAGLPWPNTLFRVLVLATVLSVLNSQIYCASRMLFSMARAGQAPASLGHSTVRGPVRAVIVTGAGSIAVLVASTWLVAGVYVVATAIATTGLLFVWMAIFLTEARRRLGRNAAAPGVSMQKRVGAIASVAGALAVITIAASTLLIDEFAPTLLIGLPFLLSLWIGHAVFKFIPYFKRSKHRAPANAGRSSAPLLVE